VTGGHALAAVRDELLAAAEPDRVPTLQRFFKTGPGEYGEGDRLLGVRVPAVRAIARRHADLPLPEVTHLLASPIHEERLTALVILVRRYERGDEAERQAMVAVYLAHARDVSGWDLVDASAPQILGAHLLDRPRGLLDELARSDSVWERRIAIMATFAFVRAGQHDDTLRLARRLLHDEHDLIHKATGWMLREVGKRDEERLVGFLEEHGTVMPRTMLRYAAERLDPALRARLMAR
jgi:3-methyladenine DNA glycosylase AlkD